MDNILLTICARGGSKGVKGKNIRPIAGKPLIGYTIDQALRWGKATHVVVSTESDEIADVAKSFGAEVPFKRPMPLANDTVGKIPVLKHAFMASEKYFKKRFDILVDLDVTAPIRTTRDLDHCLELFLSRRPKSLFSVVKAAKNPYFNMVERNKRGGVNLCKKLGKSVLRRQDSPQVYSLNAAIYFYARDFLVTSTQTTGPITDRSEIYLMDDLCGIDIDREIDFQFIEFLIRQGMVKL